MPHQCTIGSKELDKKSGGYSVLASKWLSLIVISPENHLCPIYFRSETGVKAEKMKQLCSRHPYIIHPLSEFRKWYDVCILFIYIMMLVVKPIDSSIGRNQSMHDVFPYYREFSLGLDVVSWFNIALQFGLGYSDAKEKLIEMRPSKIARNYIGSPLFTVDILSSIPRYLIYVFVPNKRDEYIRKRYMGLLNIFCMMKFIRIFTVLKLIHEVSRSFGVKSSTLVFLTSAIMTYLFVIHMASSIIIAVPRLVQYNFGKVISGTPEFLKMDFKKNYREVYMRAVFKSSACLLGVRYDLHDHRHIEDYFVTILIYVIGKIIIAITWRGVQNIREDPELVEESDISDIRFGSSEKQQKMSRSMDIKYHEIINQLNEYMRQKQLPLELRQRILQLYIFKYQGIYFKENLVNNLLSDKLRNDINVHLCRSLIENVPLFAELTSSQVNRVVALLVPEIFLPRDVIIQSGTNGDSMYFLSSGTVAVYTHSGKEICHLQDGEYFGEISLVMKGQKRTATVVAVEITQVYKLKKIDFEKTLAKNRPVFESLVQRAEIKLKENLLLEDSYKRELFEKTYATATAPVTN